MASAGAEQPPGGRLGVAAVVALVVVALDQLTKWWALENVVVEAMPVVWTLQLRVTRNTGAAFSLLAGEDLGPLLALLAVVVVGVLVWQGRLVGGRFGTVCLGLVLGGALGNLLDRVARGEGLLDGAVVDFIDFGWWPVFNLADAAIVVGSIGLVAVYAFGERESPESTELDPSDASDVSAGPTGPRAGDETVDHPPAT